MAKKKVKNDKILSRGHLTLCFLSDGIVNIHTKGIENRKEIAERFVEICKLIVNQPELAYHATGVCKEAKSN